MRSAKVPWPPGVEARETEGAAIIIVLFPDSVGVCPRPPGPPGGVGAGPLPLVGLASSALPSDAFPNEAVASEGAAKSSKRFVAILFTRLRLITFEWSM